MREEGITIGGKHTTEFGLRMNAMYIPQPKTKTHTISVPGSSGSIDLTEASGEVSYEDRSGMQFEFTVQDEGYEKWAAIMTQVSMWVHGKKQKVVVDNDTGYYYMCRMEVDGKKSNPVLGTIVLKGTAEPFKYEVQTSAEPWKWDTFNFCTGVIRNNLLDVIIDNSAKTVLVHSGGYPETPEFVVEETSNLALVHNGKTYNMMLPGTYRFPAVKVGSDEVTLHFTGTGKLTIKYRGKYL